MLLVVLLSYLLGFSEPVQATQFGPNDVHNPDAHLACWRSLGRGYNDLLTNEDMVVAHRTLPCGSFVYVCSPRTLRCTSARVGDRGPFGRYRRGKRRGQFVSMLDLAPAVARRIGFNGYEPVWFWPTRDVRPVLRLAGR